MGYLKSQLGTILTAVVLAVSGGIAVGRLDTRQDTLCERQAALVAEIGRKADTDSVRRELDVMAARLERIEAKLDRLLERGSDR